MKVLVFGEVLFDVYPNDRFIGGASFNFSAHCARQGLEAYLLSAIGKDALGDDALKRIDGFGINASFVQRSDKPTGQVSVTLDENSVPSYLVHTDTAYDNIGIDEDTLSNASKIGFDCLYFGTLCQRNSVSRTALRRIVEEMTFKDIFCDVNIRESCYDADSVRFCLENATILKISEEEEPALQALGMYIPSGEGISAVARAICGRYRNIKVLIITLGGKGSYAYDPVNDAEYFQEAMQCKVVSTVGAGDSFGAAFLTAYLSGNDIRSCLKRGAELSGYVVSHTEAVPE